MCDYTLCCSSYCCTAFLVWLRLLLCWLLIFIGPYGRPQLPVGSAQAAWSEFMQDNVVGNNATRQFCTEALTIYGPRERMSDR